MPAFWRGRLVAAALAITPLQPVAAAAAEEGRRRCDAASTSTKPTIGRQRRARSTHSPGD
jgi:hypothetical protein